MTHDDEITNAIRHVRGSTTDAVSTYRQAARVLAAEVERLRDRLSSPTVDAADEVEPAAAAEPELGSREHAITEAIAAVLHDHDTGIAEFCSSAQIVARELQRTRDREFSDLASLRQEAKLHRARIEKQGDDMDRVLAEVEKVQAKLESTHKTIARYATPPF